jgi:hypothetical protein
MSTDWEIRAAETEAAWHAGQERIRQEAEASARLLITQTVDQHRFVDEMLTCVCGVECGLNVDELTHAEHVADIILGTNVLITLVQLARPRQ